MLGYLKNFLVHFNVTLNLKAAITIANLDKRKPCNVLIITKDHLPTVNKP